MNLIPEYVIKLHILQFELPSVVIAVGIITTIFPLVGCIGALRESKCFLISSGTLLILTIIIQMALFCYLLCWSGEDIEHVLNIAWTKNTNDFKYPMDGYQFLFACCGLKSYEDYLKNSKEIPSTCCGYLAGECEEQVYKERPGCRQTVVEYWELCINAIEFIAIIAVTEEQGFLDSRFEMNFPDSLLLFIDAMVKRKNAGGSFGSADYGFAGNIRAFSSKNSDIAKPVSANLKETMSIQEAPHCHTLKQSNSFGDFTSSTRTKKHISAGGSEQACHPRCSMITLQ
uniref:Tetraspanin n=1 Tax=Glossina austeni TaxID=7395 RepID=A0A1A9VR54_GLOAU